MNPLVLVPQASGMTNRSEASGLDHPSTQVVLSGPGPLRTSLPLASDGQLPFLGWEGSPTKIDYLESPSDPLRMGQRPHYLGQ